MEKIELRIVALSHSVTQNQNYAVVMGGEHSDKRLPIVIGGFEAQAIAIALEDMIAPRPLTHDLFKHTLDAFHIKLKEVIISDLMEGIFYAKLVCESNGEVKEIDSRTSDAIALAVRFDCPIFTYKHIMEEAGVVFGEVKEEKSKNVPVVKESKSIKSISVEGLNVILDKALAEEDYEKAAEIRDELKRRKDLG